MRTIIFAIIAVALTAGITIHAQSAMDESYDKKQLAKLENLAEQGDTAAMHRLIEFYEENAEYLIHRELTEAEKQHYYKLGLYEATDTTELVVNELYAQRLEKWLGKGLAMNDPVAILTTGLHLYYEDETAAIELLRKAADAGNARAALFCGSACFNQGRMDEAFRYLSSAYRLGEPSAGWHLAMCYADGAGTARNREKAIEVMRHAAILNYPEAVLEMRRIEPENRIWQDKVDSLEIDFSDLPIIPDE